MNAKKTVAATDGAQLEIVHGRDGALRRPRRVAAQSSAGIGPHALPVPPAGRGQGQRGALSLPERGSATRSDSKMQTAAVALRLTEPRSKACFESVSVRIYLFIFFLSLALTPLVHAQPNSPHLAYVYPAGGRQGTTFQVTVGGQYLVAVSNAAVSGTGIQAAVVEYNRPMNGKEFNDLRDELKNLQIKLRDTRGYSNGTNVWTAADQARLAELRAKILKNPPNRQGSPALVETVLLRITIATNAAPGGHEIRLRTPNALSNPLNFYVGQLREYSKPPAKSADPDLSRFLERLGGTPVTNTPRSNIPITLPATVNGQIMPGGVDRYWFAALAGQQLVINIGARTLIPYLADAVPGWFEATATICDAKGHELAYDDRFRFRPDPLMHFSVPKSGDYCVEIHDSIYRGREDFIYRMTIGELPYVTDIFPLGGPAGAKTTIELTGWNLPKTELTLDNTGKEPGIYPISAAGKSFNTVPFAVDTLPECAQQEINNTTETAQAVTLPVIVNGRIESPGDCGVFRFEGRAGEQIVAEVMARRLDSPLDSTLELTDATGKRLAFNDDFDDQGEGLETHHADSYLTATLPAAGTYFIRIADAQQQGGSDFAYRLRLSEPRPDFALRVTPASLNVRAGLSVPVTVFALRKDGFTNAIELQLKDAPPGFSLSGARIAANQDKAQFTLKAPPLAGKEPILLAVEGRATLAGQELVHTAIPADDMMQAFAYWHLVPAQALEVAVAPNPRPFASNALKILSATPVKIPAGGTARVRIATPSSAFVDRFALELSGAPPGITIQNVSPDANGIELTLHCDAANAKPGDTGNLIVNIVPKTPPAAQSVTKPKNQNQRRNQVGTLPAIPFEIVSE
jgi:hypothetical protein